jgi:hypothetical protein
MQPNKAVMEKDQSKAMRKTFFSVNWLTVRFQFLSDFYETINHDFFYTI